MFRILLFGSVVCVFCSWSLFVGADESALYRIDYVSVKRLEGGRWSGKAFVYFKKPVSMTVGNYLNGQIVVDIGEISSLDQVDGLVRDNIKATIGNQIIETSKFRDIQLKNLREVKEDLDRR